MVGSVCTRNEAKVVSQSESRQAGSLLCPGESEAERGGRYSWRRMRDGQLKEIKCCSAFDAAGQLDKMQAGERTNERTTGFRQLTTKASKLTSRLASQASNRHALAFSPLFKTGVHKIQLRAAGTTPLSFSQRRYRAPSFSLVSQQFLLPSLSYYKQRRQPNWLASDGRLALQSGCGGQTFSSWSSSAFLSLTFNAHKHNPLLDRACSTDNPSYATLLITLTQTHIQYTHTELVTN